MFRVFLCLPLLVWGSWEERGDERSGEGVVCFCVLFLLFEVGRDERERERLCVCEEGQTGPTCLAHDGFYVREDTSIKSIQVKSKFCRCGLDWIAVVRSNTNAHVLILHAWFQ